MSVIDPVSSVSQAISDVAIMVTKAIPSDEQRMQAFKERHPKRYARLRIWMLEHCRRHLAFRWHEPIDEYVELVAGGFLQDERDYMKKLLHSSLKR